MIRHTSYGGEKMLYAVLILSSFIASLISGAAGFGGSILLLPMVIACVGTETAVPVLTIAQLIGNVSRMAFGLKSIDWKSVGLFCLTALPLTSLGAFGFSLLPKDIVTRYIGMFLVAVVLLKMMKKVELKESKGTILIGGAITGGLSGLAGSGGPIGAAVFLSLELSPVAYIASEAATATAMHIVKTIIYSKLMNLSSSAFLTGLAMGGAMVGGTYIANRFIQKIDRTKFQKYIAALLLIAGIFMITTGE